MTAEELCHTNLLDDSPAGDDEFGSHERVAQAIIESLETEDENQIEKKRDEVTVSKTDD